MLESRYVESWESLSARLERRDTLTCWAAAEPALAGLSLADLHAVTTRGADRTRADGVLGALVRVAAADRGADADAALVTAHLLGDGIGRLVRQISDLTDDALPLVLGEVIVQIRAFPWRTRTRSFAANILMDTRAKLMEELLGVGRHDRGRFSSTPWDPGVLLERLDRTGNRPGNSNDTDGDGDVDVADLLLMALQHGVVDGADLQLLIELIGSRDDAGRGRLALARHLGVNERTIRRRRDRTLTALRAWAPAYLTAAA